MNLKQYVSVLRRYWVVLAAMTITGAVAGLLAALSTQPTYEASAQAYLSSESASTIQDLTQSGSFSQQAVSSFADVAVTPYVLDPVIEKLNLNETAAQLAQRVTVEAPINTVVLQISVRDADVARAIAIADGISSSLGDAVQQLTPTTNSGAAQVRLTQIQSAKNDVLALGLTTFQQAVLGAAGGLLAGVAVAVALALHRDQLRSRADVKALTDAPFLGTVRYEIAHQSSPLVSRAQNASRARRMDDYDSVRTNIRWSNIDTTRKIFVVTSSLPGEGKTTTAANLAAALAVGESRVLALDADLRRPRLAAAFGIDSELGLTDVLTAQLERSSCVQRIGDSGVYVLPAGPIPPNANELLQSKRMSTLLEQLREDYDYVVIDTPPVLAVSDAAVIAKQADGTIMVVGAATTKRSQVRLALDLLRQLSVPLVGLVLNGVLERDLEYSTYYTTPGVHESSAPVITAPVEASTSSSTG